MEEYKKKVKKRRVLFIVLILVGVGLSIYNALIVSHTDGSMHQGIVDGFIYGIVISMMMLSLIGLIKCNKALKEDKKLRVMYNQENDERMKVIRAKAGMPLVAYTSIALMIIAVIASKFSILVFETIIAVVLFQLIVANVSKFYYKAKM